jgi:hypothetical protein
VEPGGSQVRTQTQSCPESTQCIGIATKFVETNGAIHHCLPIVGHQAQHRIVRGDDLVVELELAETHAVRAPVTYTYLMREARQQCPALLAQLSGCMRLTLPAGVASFPVASVRGCMGAG